MLDRVPSSNNYSFSEGKREMETNEMVFRKHRVQELFAEMNRLMLQRILLLMEEEVLSFDSLNYYFHILHLKYDEQQRHICIHNCAAYIDDKCVYDDMYMNMSNLILLLIFKGDDDDDDDDAKT